MQPEQQSFLRRISPLCTIQFLGVFNDNAFKMFATLSVVGASSSTDIFKDSAYLMLLTLAYVLPFIALPLPAGALADHMPKRYIMMISKVVEFLVMLLGVAAFAGMERWGMWPVMAVMLLMTTQSAFFSPAFNGILPETFPESELSRANGDVGVMSFLGAILGMGFAPFIRTAAGGNMAVCGSVLCVIALLGLLSSVSVVPVITVVQRHKELAYRMCDSRRMGIHELCQNADLMLAALGDGFFLAIGVAVQLLLVLFAKYNLNETSDLGIGCLQLAPAFGMGVGCYLAGRLSSGKVELGLVPFGALGMALALPLAAYLPGETTVLSLTVPHLYVSKMFELNVNLHINAMFWLGVAGFCGGLFVIPLRSYFQQRVRPEARGAALACNNAICFLLILLSTVLTFAFALGACRNDPNIPAAFRPVASVMPCFDPKTLLVATGVVTFGVTLLTMWLLPNFMLRFIIITLGHSLYRLRITGTENIPERGPCLLLCNHVSFIDGILISACTSRKVRFLMHEDYYSSLILNPIARLTRFIKVPSAGKHKSMGQMFDLVKEAFREGDVICVFPEGKITRNGSMSEFKHGYEKMLPDDVDVTIVPVNISYVWGSIFSYYYGKIKLRMPKRLPHFSAITFGKPVPRSMTPFEIRQRISELAAETAMLPRPYEMTLQLALARQARFTPFRVLMCDAGGGQLNAFQLYWKSILVSREVRSLVPSDCKYVGVLLPNSTAAGVAMMSVLLADKVPCPLNYSTSQEVFELSVHKAEISCIITSRRFLDKIKISQTPEMVFLEDLAKRIPVWKALLAAAGIVVLPCDELLNIVTPLSRRDLFATAALLFSSGSTGIPKGVMLSHHNMSSDIYSVKKAVGYTRQDRILGNLPLFHSFGLNVCFWLPVMSGAQVVYTMNPLDGTGVCNAIEKYKLTMMFATPTFMQKYLHRLKDGQLDSIRLAVTGAEKLRADISRNFHEKVPRLQIVEGFGCTELSPVVSINLPPELPDLGRTYGVEGSIGVALENICARVVDPLTFKPVAPDAEGLLFVKGPIVMQGYLKEPEQTEKVLIDGYYNTGDIARMDERGYITICGRLSRFSKIAGEMVPHELVECAISEICSSENRVVAVGGIPDAAKGEALIVLYTEETPLSPEQIVEQLRERSISNLWIPKAANFHKVERLPLLGSGKLDLTVLRKEADRIAAERAAQEAAPETKA